MLDNLLNLDSLITPAAQYGPGGGPGWGGNMMYGWGGWLGGPFMIIIWILLIVGRRRPDKVAVRRLQKGPAHAFCPLHPGPRPLPGHFARTLRQGRDKLPGVSGDEGGAGGLASAAPGSAILRYRHRLDLGVYEKNTPAVCAHRVPCLALPGAAAGRAALPDPGGRRCRLHSVLGVGRLRLRPSLACRLALRSPAVPLGKV